MTPEIDRDTLIARLEEAGRTLLSLPSARGPAGYGSSWPAFVREHIEAYGWEGVKNRPARPSAAAITRMDEAWRWVALIPLTPNPPGAIEPFSQHGGAVERRLVLMRALVDPMTGKHLWPWRRLGREFCVSHEAVRLWHGKAIVKIVAALKRNGESVVRRAA